MKDKKTDSFSSCGFLAFCEKRSWLLLFSLFLMLSCDKAGEVPPLGLDYFPIALGDYRIYDVTETTYVDKDSTIENYQLRESFFDTIENENQTTYLMRVERRETELNDWISIENIAIRQTTATLEYQKQNMTFVKMSYPVKVSREWDGNAQNSESEQVYHFKKLASSDFTFEDSAHIKVIISDLPANIVEQDQRFEIYAQGIGLVERNFIEIYFCQQRCSEVNEKENGRIFVQKLIEYGSE